MASEMKRPSSDPTLVDNVHEVCRRTRSFNPSVNNCSSSENAIFGQHLRGQELLAKLPEAATWLLGTTSRCLSHALLGCGNLWFRPTVLPSL